MQKKRDKPVELSRLDRLNVDTGFALSLDTAKVSFSNVDFNLLVTSKLDTGLSFNLKPFFGLIFLAFVTFVVIVFFTCN